MNITHCCECEKLRRKIKTHDSWIIRNMAKWLTAMPIKKRLEFFDAVEIVKGIFNVRDGRY